MRTKFKRRFFPDPAIPTIDGIVAMGDEFTVDILYEAYYLGIFPWPHPDLPCLWFCPDERGVLDFTDLHMSHSFKKFRRKTKIQITINQSFDAVMKACAAQPRPGQSGTWITPPLLKAYREFHRAGYAHSVECWLDGQLVGGMYGVLVEGVFSAESMFYKVSNASKLALIHWVEHLQKLGFHWMDIQMVTPVTEALGGKYISKMDFLERLSDSRSVSN